MKLHKVATHFDKVSFRDAYTDAFMFKAQLELVHGSVRDSVTKERRTMNIKPGITMPARGCIKAHGVVFMAGAIDYDSYNDQPIRGYVVLQNADFLAQVKTLGETCLVSPGVSAYAALVLTKDIEYKEESSQVHQRVNLYFCKNEPVTPGKIVIADGVYYIIRSSISGPSGMQIVSADVLEAPFRLATFSSGVYDPATETVVTAYSQLISVLRCHWQALYDYQNNLTHKMQPGDIQVAISKNVTPKPGDKLTFSDGVWDIKSKVEVDDAWVCHASKVI